MDIGKSGRPYRRNGVGSGTLPSGNEVCEFDKHRQLLRHLLIGEKWFFDAVLPGMHLLYGLLSCGNDIR